jgi:hypothetical protein
MTDLERIRAGRTDDVERTLARRIEPTAGFVAYGVLWLIVASIPLVAAMIGGAFVGALLFGGDSSGQTGLIILASGIGLALGYWPFVRWARRKRARARRVVREGVLCDAVVATRTTDRAVQSVARFALAAGGGSAGGAHWERVEFEHAGVRYSSFAPFGGRSGPGTPAQVLFAPDAPYGLAFSPSGHAFATRVRRA